jgi:hypothetical protein
MIGRKMQGFLHDLIRENNSRKIQKN